MVRSRAMEKQKNKSSQLRESFSWVYYPPTRELSVTEKMKPHANEGGNEEQGESEEFLSVKSCFSMYSSSSANGEAFYSVKTNLSRCSSLNEFDLSEYWKRSIIQEFCHCEGWPFGLCRKAVLLPPLPKSPSESWLYRKIQPSTKVTWSLYICTCFCFMFWWKPELVELYWIRTIRISTSFENRLVIL